MPTHSGKSAKQRLHVECFGCPTGSSSLVDEREYLGVNSHLQQNGRRVILSPSTSWFHRHVIKIGRSGCY